MDSLKQQLIDMLDKMIEGWIEHGMMNSRQHLVMLVPEDFPFDHLKAHGKRIRCIHRSDIPSGMVTPTSLYLVRRVDYTRQIA